MTKKNVKHIVYFVLFVLVLFNARCKLIIEDGVLIKIQNGIFEKKAWITSIEIPEGVKHIGSAAFINCRKLKEIQIPDTVISIGDSAFNGCTSLKEIDIPDSVLVIGQYAFYECSNLRTVKLPKNLKIIEIATFNNCVALQTISLPDNLTTIKLAAFEKCFALESIELPDSVTVIANEAFLSCTSLKQIRTPEQITNVGTSVFEDTELLNSQEYDEYGCKYIGEILVDSIKKGSSIKVRTGTKAIAGEVFKDSNVVTEVELPDSLLGIGSFAFENCVKLENINFPDHLQFIGENAFSRSKITNVELPDGFLELGYGVFSDCSRLNRVVLPDSVIKVGAYVFSNTPWYENIETDEYGCKYYGGILLSNYCKKPVLKIKEGTRIIASSNAYSNVIVEQIECPDSLQYIGIESFQGYQNLKHIELSENLIEIGPYAFYRCYVLDNIELPESLITLVDGAFRGCPLKEVTIPSNVMNIENTVFQDCSKLEKINAPIHLKYLFQFYRPIEIIYY